MIVQIIGENGEVLGSKDVTGTQWTAGLDRFVNVEPIVVDMDKSGVAAGGQSVDHAGRRLFPNRPIGRLSSAGQRVKEGDRIHIDAERWIIDFS